MRIQCEFVERTEGVSEPKLCNFQLFSVFRFVDLSQSEDKCVMIIILLACYSYYQN